jgi:hypothetical protein
MRQRRWQCGLALGLALGLRLGSAWGLEPAEARVQVALEYAQCTAFVWHLSTCASHTFTAQERAQWDAYLFGFMVGSAALASAEAATAWVALEVKYIHALIEGRCDSLPRVAPQYRPLCDTLWRDWKGRYQYWLGRR